jgi:hypothetical protein
VASDGEPILVEDLGEELTPGKVSYVASTAAAKLVAAKSAIAAESLPAEVLSTGHVAAMTKAHGAAAVVLASRQDNSRDTDAAGKVMSNRVEDTGVPTSSVAARLAAIQAAEASSTLAQSVAVGGVAVVSAMAEREALRTNAMPEYVYVRGGATTASPANPRWCS